MYRKYLLLSMIAVLSLSFYSNSAIAQSKGKREAPKLVIGAKTDRVDEYVKSVMQKQHIPGLSLAIIKDGKIIKVAGYGLANVELNVAATPETVYKIASVSKQLIAAGILILVQEGKILLEDKVSKYFEGTPDTWKDITVKHLLTHTSGLAREAPGYDNLKIQPDLDIIKTAYSLPLRFAPGEKWEYCNVGYFMLAEIIHKVTGKAWSNYLHERLFSPLEMNVTRPTGMTDIIPHRADGYAWSNGKLENATNYFALRPSGAFLSNVLDLAKWDAALYTDKIFKQSMRDLMWSPVKLNNGTTHPYGFGWLLDTLNDHKVVMHGGVLPGFRAVLARFLDDKLTVVVLTNGQNADTSSIAFNIAALNITNLIPERVVAKIESGILDTYVGQYQPNPDTIVTVTRDNYKLMMQQGANSEQRELLPENETTFFNKDNRRATFKFIKDDKGNVEYLVQYTETREINRAKKIK